ncbi:MAG: bifunctional enoyl-CoA hydratase/phosphate acetyltransferase [Firmicutes bacterium]|nr:bifunctional enoyl-CoA hydratase/phosphate acetyltransferase [Bacillota bacterium]
MRDFSAIVQEARRRPQKRVAVAMAEDEEVLLAIKQAQEMGIAWGILIGQQEKIRRVAERISLALDGDQVIQEDNYEEAARRAVAMVKHKEADIAMKGLLQTGDFLRAVLDREIGLRTGRLLSHVAVVEVPTLDRLLFATDGGLNINPNLSKKVEITKNAISFVHRLGLAEPKVAVLTAVELVNPDMPSTIDAAAITMMAQRGQITGAIVDGPLALDNALSFAAARHKGITSPVAGLADILVFPDLDAGNMLVKSLLYLARAKMAGVVVGTSAPVVVLSRHSTDEEKLTSIALAVIGGAENG